MRVSSRLCRGGIIAVAVLWLACGPVGCRTAPGGQRPFRFPADTLAVTNETRWIYSLDPTSGKQIHTPRNPPPTYSLHCFVIARTAKQFNRHAQFNPSAPKVTADEYRGRIRSVLSRSPRSGSAESDRIEIPGYANLHAFSADYPDLFRREAGGAWRSYLQRGNWRMILPFTRKGQDREAARLVQTLRAGNVPVVHISEFPRLRINHAVLFFDAEEIPGGHRFLAYDPNDPNHPVAFTHEPSSGFIMPPTSYFLGGPVKVYEIYHSWSR